MQRIPTRCSPMATGVTWPRQETPGCLHSCATPVPRASNSCTCALQVNFFCRPGDPLIAGLTGVFGGYPGALVPAGGLPLPLPLPERAPLPGPTIATIRGMAQPRAMKPGVPLPCSPAWHAAAGHLLPCKLAGGDGDIQREPKVSGHRVPWRAIQQPDAAPGHLWARRCSGLPG